MTARVAFAVARRREKNVRSQGNTGWGRSRAEDIDRDPTTMMHGPENSRLHRNRLPGPSVLRQ